MDAKTVKEYYQILIDTLLGTYIEPFTRKTGRDSISSTPKFYLFDVGVANFIARRNISVLKGSEAGKAFEHFILMELLAYRGLNDLDFDIKFWRTKTGLEVDFVLSELNKARIAIEVKIDDNVHKTDIKGLIAFKEENPDVQALVVSLDPRPRKMIINDAVEITVLPGEEFLKRLWSHRFLTVG